jgi:hypothetical protein
MSIWMARPLFALSLLAGVGLVREAAADCTCRAGGRDFDLGASTCLTTPTGARLATCDMVLNNTSWRISGTPCVSAETSDPGNPPQRTVHPTSPRGKHPHS